MNTEDQSERQWHGTKSGRNRFQHEVSNRAFFDVIIVGGGLAGLTAAALLSRAGKRIALFEAAKHLGGRAQTARKAGSLLNLGAHALYKAGAAYRILSELDALPDGGSPSSNGTFVRDHADHPFPSNPIRIVRSALLSWKEKIEFARLMLQLQRNSLHPAPTESETFAQWLERACRHETVRRILRALSRLWTYAHDADQLSAAAVLKQAQLGMKGVIYVHGGWQTIVNQLSKCIHPDQSVIQLTKVKRVLGNTTVQGVRLEDGTEVTSRHVILAIPPNDCRRLLQHTAAAEQCKKWATDLIPVRAACLDIALESVADPNQTIALGLDEPFYYANQSMFADLHDQTASDQAIRVNKKPEVIHVARYLSRNDSISAQEARRSLESFLDRIQPGWQNQIRHARFFPHLTVTYALPGVNGRAKSNVEELNGAYVVGDWVGEEGMLADAALASARRAVQSILQQTP